MHISLFSFNNELELHNLQVILNYNYFQGFHILTDSTNAFAGLSSSCIEHLRDDYDRKSLLVLPVIPSYFPDNVCDSDEGKAKSLINDSVRVLNLALSFNEYNKHSNLLVPLSTGEMGWRQPGQKRLLQYINYNVRFFYNNVIICSKILILYSSVERWLHFEFLQRKV